MNKNKLLVILITSLMMQSSYAQAMKQKKVCNLLDNGAEFCTIFNVPVQETPTKSIDEINKELENQSELVFTEKYKKSKNTQDSNKDKINNSVSENKKNINQELEHKIDAYVPLEKKDVSKQEQEKETKPKKEQVKRDNLDETKKKEEGKNIKLKKEDAPKEAAADIKPKSISEKDKKSFDDYLKALKSLDK